MADCGAECSYFVHDMVHTREESRRNKERRKGTSKHNTRLASSGEKENIRHRHWWGWTSGREQPRTMNADASIALSASAQMKPEPKQAVGMTCVERAFSEYYALLYLLSPSPFPITRAVSYGPISPSSPPQK